MRFDERSAVGVLDMLQDRPHTRSAVAVTDVHVLAISAEDWLEMLEDNFDATRGAIVGISTNAMTIGKTIGGGAFEEPAAAEGALPPDPLNLVERLLVLRDLPAFRATRIQALTSLAEIADEVRLAQGEVLIQEKQPQSSIHFLAHGLVRIASEAPPVSAVFGARSVVAGYAAFAAVSGYTAVAERPSVLLRIDREDFFDVVEDHFEVARSLLGYLATERARLGARVATRSIPPPSVPLPERR
jgi:CRP-like cAMP-binding protein